MSSSVHTVVRGTVDLLILKALAAGPRHGYAIAEWIAQASGGVLSLTEGTLYPALHRLEIKGFVRGRPGVSQNKRRAKYHELTPLGRESLASESAAWLRYVEAAAKALRSE